MTPGVPTKVIAASCGLTAFAVALLAGLAADNPVESILGRAIVSMVVCQVLGWIVGTIGERTIADAVERLRSAAAVAAEPGAGPKGGADE